MSRPKRARWFEPSPPPGSPRGCDHPGCAELGGYRAPRGRDKLDEHYWFCLEHVREYNAAWDYFRGMSEADIERHRRADTVGNRPTWPLGSRTGGYRFDQESMRRAFRAYFGGDDEAPKAAPARPRTETDEALATLELSEGCTLATIKARYKELVKRHHPDANGGDKAAEEKLKTINQAYGVLKAALKNEAIA